MSLTIEFYSAEPQELVALFTKLVLTTDDTTFDALSDVLQSYTKVEFPGHLLIPDDLDSLCWILKKYRLSLSAKFADSCVGEIWNDNLGTESLTLLTTQFTKELTLVNEKEIHDAALAWFTTFNYQLSSPSQSPAYQAVLRLQIVAGEAFTHERALILHIEGVPAFFNYLRYL